MINFSKLTPVTNNKKKSHDKLKKLSVVKAKSPTKNINKNIETPHTILCEVFFVSGEYCVFINSKKYVIEITKSDYYKAEYAYSTDKHPYYKAGKLRPMECEDKTIDYISDYWNLVAEGKYVYVYIVNDYVKIDMIKTNKYNAELWKTIKEYIDANKSNQRLHCSDTRIDGVLKAKPL